jgi:hypothetical protein
VDEGYTEGDALGLSLRDDDGITVGPDGFSDGVDEGYTLGDAVDGFDEGPALDKTVGAVDEVSLGSVV